MGNEKIRLLAAAIALTFGGAAFAESCNPRDFAALSYDRMNDFERLIYLSSTSEEKIKEIRADHHGKMTIPYINVPASGDFSYFQSQINQLRNIILQASTRETDNTVIRARLEADGVEAYKACLRERRAWISVSPANLFTKSANLVVNWYDDRSPSAELNNVKILNGTIVGEYKAKLGRSESSIIQIERGDLTLPTTVSLTVDGTPAEVSLPVRPAYRLQLSARRFPSRVVKAESWHGNGYQDQTVQGSIAAPSDAQFLLGTATVADFIRRNCGSCTAENSDMAASVKCAAASPRKGWGCSAEAFGIVTVIEAVRNE